MAPNVWIPLLLGLALTARWWIPKLLHLFLFLHYAKSPALRASARRVPLQDRHHPGRLWAALAHERDALDKASMAAFEPGDGRAVALATGVLAWNTMGMQGVGFQVVIDAQDIEMREAFKRLDHYVGLALDPGVVTRSGIAHEHQVSLLEQAGSVQDTMIQLQKIFGSRPSVSWAVFASKAIACAFPRARVTPTIHRDPMGTAWANTLLRHATLPPHPAGRPNGRG